MLRWFFVVILLLAGCTAASSTPTEPPPDPSTLLNEAVDNIRESKTFRMLLEQTGADYRFAIDLNGLQTAVLRRAEAQFVAPDVLYATVNILLAELPVSIDIFARDSNQWLRLAASPWLNVPFAAGFDPGTLLSKNSGFQRALTMMTGLSFVGSDTLDDGTPVYHVRGTASGASVKDLLVGLVESVTDVLVDVYIHQTTRFPVMVVITQPDTATEQQPEDTTWRVELFDVNAEPKLDDPEAAQ